MGDFEGDYDWGFEWDFERNDPVLVLRSKGQPTARQRIDQLEHQLEIAKRVIHLDRELRFHESHHCNHDGKEPCDELFELSRKYGQALVEYREIVENR